MQKNAVSVLGVSEVRWKGQGEIKCGDYTVYYYVNTSSILHLLHDLYLVSPSVLAIFNNVLHTITGIKTTTNNMYNIKYS
jgi:hypothetical protein